MSWGEVISLGRQLANHQTAISSITPLNGNQSLTDEYFANCLYTVTIGSNDYINNYLSPHFYNSSTLFTPIQYAKTLAEQYSEHLQTLHKLGARKIAVFELGAIGCAPSVVSKLGMIGTLCIDKVNGVVDLFNDELKVAVDDLNDKLTDAKFVLIKVKSPSSRMSSIPGVKISTSPCCEKIDFSTGQCIPKQSPCSNRIAHIFFDGFHPSESVNCLLAKLAAASISPLFDNTRTNNIRARL